MFMKGPKCSLLSRSGMILSVAVIVVSGGVAFQASGQIVTMSDINSVVQVNTGNQAGMFNWTVDGHNYLAQQWFWYRIGTNGGEHSIDTISAPTITTPDGRTLYTRYNNGSYGVEVDYQLTGFSVGSGHSQVNESISITNSSASTLDFRFFQFSDFNLSASDGVILSRNIPDNLWQKAIQTNSAGGALNEQVTVAPHATHAQADTSANLLSLLNDANPTTLNDVAGAGPGNVAWAFEWDLSIAPGSSVLISKLKTLQVPEPSVAALLVAGAAGLVMRNRRQTRK
jgi:hypothetical protein